MAEISARVEDFKSKNWKIEREQDNFKSNQCRVTGKSISDDFYMYPAGYICLPSAAPSPDVCPLTGNLLSPYKATTT